MKKNPLLALRELGQSVWLDFLGRSLIDSGMLARLIEEDGVSGVTSNPAIFEKAIDGSADYDDAIRALALRGRSVPEIYEALVVDDIRRAADLFRPLHERRGGADGFVSLEVSPLLARDAAGTVAEARRLWAAVGRPNVFIKVPATAEGIGAIRQLIREGINVNVTLLFGLPRYAEVARAHLEGLEGRAAAGEAVDRVASVASFFLSRIDVLVDSLIEKRLAECVPGGDIAAGLRGKTAIASAKEAYRMYREIYGGTRFASLASRGARPQRLLWASTSTKNPAYPDVMYVEPLIGPETVTTLPIETLDAYRDHGDPAPRIGEGAREAREALRLLAEAGIDIDEATQRLENEGVEKFIAPFDTLAASLAKKREAALGGRR